jgi:TolB-like protein
MSTKTTMEATGLYSQEHIHAQIQKIFRCSVFSVSDILRRFLSYIIDETLAGRSNTIKEYTIAVNVLNKPVNFKPQHDAIVRIHAGRLRRALNYYYKEAGLADDIEISVPKGSYVPVFRNKCLKISDQEPDSSPFHVENMPETITIAVMPFSTLETDISRQAFTDNLGQQLSAELGRFPDFSVISYYTTQRLNSENRDIQELTNQFGAQYVITGNVQFAAKKLRVAIQLTETFSGAQIWAEIFRHNYSSSGLFEVGDDIVSSIIAVTGDFNGIIIQQSSRGLTKSKTGIPYLTTHSWYNSFYSRFNAEAFRNAFAAMEYAVERNPADELAWAFYGQLSLLAFLFNENTRESPVVQGLRSARVSLRINPHSQYGHLALALAYIHLHNRQSALDTLEYTITLNPNAAGITGICGCLMIAAGEYERGIELIRTSMSRNKSYPPLFKLFIGLYHFKQKEYALALACSDEMAIPAMDMNTILRTAILSQMGQNTGEDIRSKSPKNNSSNESWISKEFLDKLLLDQDLAEQIFKGFRTSKASFLTVA